MCARSTALGARFVAHAIAARWVGCVIEGGLEVLYSVPAFAVVLAHVRFTLGGERPRL
jgi:hypothetical protein